MPFLNIPLSGALMGWYVLLWCAMAVSPADWANWVLSSVLPALVVGGLVVARRSIPLSAASYLMIGIFLTLHTVGAHYTYAGMPLGQELASVIGQGRNHYDRFVHFAFGLLLAAPIRELFARLTGARGVLLYYLTAMTVVGLSGLWEILESWVAQIVSPELGAAYLGSQGDVWDAQKDMAAALYGVLLWLVLSVWIHRRGDRVATQAVTPRP